MDIVHISDTHKQLYASSIPDGDMLIHSGDATGRGTITEIVNFVTIFESLPHKYKIFVPGNHDWLFQTNTQLARDFFRNTTILIDESVEIEGIKIYGSPWQPEFCNWAFNLPRGPQIKRKWELIPEDTDILVTHGPPYGILDSVKKGAPPLGCQDLKNELSRIKPKLHCFGHIHGGYGKKQIGETLFSNAAICTERYRPTNLPNKIQWEILNKTKED